MHEIQRVLKRAAGRLLVADLLVTLALTATASLAALFVALLVERTFGLVFPWRPILWSVGSGAAIVAMAWSLVRRARGAALARVVDERADLRESLSTAICVAGRNDPWARATVQSAARVARGVDVRRAIPVRAPRFWPVPVAAAGVLALTWLLMPTLDLFGRLAQRQAEAEQEQQIVEARSDVQNKDEALKRLMERAQLELKDEPGEAQAFKAGDLSAAKIRKNHVRKLTDVREQARKLKQGAKARSLEAMRKALRKLRTPGPGPLEQFSRSLARGDFSKAQEALDKLSQQLADGSLSPEKQDQLRKQIENLKKQMEKIAADRRQLEQALREAGMDKQSAARAAGDMSSLKAALDKLQGLSDEQKQKLLEMAKAAMQAGQTSQQIAQSLGDLSEALQGEMGMSQEGVKAMGELGQQLSDLEMMAIEMEALDALLDEALNQLADMGGRLGDGRIGEFEEGDSRDYGMGSGGPGRGLGANTAGKDAPFKVRRARSPTKTTPGPIIGQMLVWDQQIRGESRAAFRESAAAAADAAAEAIETMRVEPEYETVVKNYFGRLKKRSQDEKTNDPETSEKPGDGN